MIAEYGQGKHDERCVQRRRRGSPPRHPRCARRRRGVGHRTRRAPGAHPAAGVEAPEGSGRGRSGGRADRRAAPPLPPRRAGVGAVAAMARQVRAADQRPLRPPRRLPRRAANPTRPIPIAQGESIMSNRSGSAVVSLPTDTEISITRLFDAPKASVWEAVTRPEHLMRWWGPESCPLVSAEVDLRVGGKWRYVARTDDGQELAWSGEYRAIDAPNGLTSTERFEPFPDAESVNTMTLTEHDGVTTLHTLVRHTSKQHRDGHIGSGMEGGMQQTFNRLDQLLVAFDSDAERFRQVAGRFSDVVAAVPESAWSNPAFCSGWTAKDPVKHLTE